MEKCIFCNSQNVEQELPTKCQGCFPLALGVDDICLFRNVLEFKDSWFHCKDCGKILEGRLFLNATRGYS